MQFTYNINSNTHTHTQHTHYPIHILQQLQQQLQQPARACLEIPSLTHRHPIHLLQQLLLQQQQPGLASPIQVQAERQEQGLGQDHPLVAGH
jgi:hypothetical protein